MRSLRSLRAIGWPVHEARVTGAFVREAGCGCDKAEIKYICRRGYAICWDKCEAIRLFAFCTILRGSV
jgi:hypothetical protein